MPEEKINDLKLDVELLKKDVEQFDTLCDRITQSIEKIQDVNQNLIKMISLHEQRHDQHEKTEEDLDDDIKELHSRITTINREIHDRIDQVEHHITETIKSIVIQPYDRRAELVDLADHVHNISAKHEGGLPEIDSQREHPSDILDYFRDKSDVIESGDWAAMEQNFLDKMTACNSSARMLTEKGLSFIAAQNLHK